LVVVTVAAEDVIGLAVLSRLVQELRAELGPTYNTGGKSGLRKRLSGFNQSAHFKPWVVLIDLDHDADCAPAVRTEWLANPAPQICFG
jgi:hypothetical protein